MNISSKFEALKKSIGGNREQKRYEETFGQPIEEQMNITPMGKMNRRLISELEFAILLSRELDGKYDSLIDSALNFLLDAQKTEGVLTNSVCLSALQIILPMSKEAKEYKLILAGHAHIDMNWMWSWHETVAATLATFRTMLSIMDEYPDFCFSQSQAAVYKIVEEFEPSMMESIKKRIAEGRWEITASAWVETDKNMPSTESLIKHIKYTKNYMRDNWGIDPDSLEIDFSPDTFGHSANLPEIDISGGVKYYYHCRALEGNQALYRWQSPSGKEMLCYREQHWYNSGITPRIAMGIFDISKRCAGFKTGLIVYGVGDHGGGPTRRDIEKAIEMSEWQVFPTIKFGTMSEFFKEAESVREKLPLVDKEMNVIFPGCYTTQSRIKMGNRKCEAAFDDAEALSAFAQFTTGRAARIKALESSYRDVLFTHFHDILTGSCVQDSREHAMGLYSNSIALANNEYLGAMNAISSAVDTSMIQTECDPYSQAEGAGVGYGVENFSGRPSPERGNGKTRIFTLFNPTAVDKNENAELTVWDYPGDMRNIVIKDTNGNILPHQLLSFRPETYWDHKFFKVLVNVSMPALSYMTAVLSEKELDSYPYFIRSHTSAAHATENPVLDNGIIRAEFNFMNGRLISLKDVASGREYIKEGQSAGFILVDTEKKSSNAWNIGKYQRIHEVSHVTFISSSNGELRSTLHFEANVMSSKIVCDVHLDKGSSRLAFNTEVDWKEVGEESVPVLAFALPLSYVSGKYMYDIPAGVTYRAPMELDVPALSFALAPSDGFPAAGFINDCKYGYRARPDGTLISTLINSATSPDPYPERGIHKFVMSVALFENNAASACKTASSACHPITYISASSHKAHLPASMSFMKIDAPNCLVSSLEASTDTGAVNIRIISLAHTESTVKLSFENKVKGAVAVDYLDRELEKKVCTENNEVCATLGAYEILTLKVSLE